MRALILRITAFTIQYFSLIALRMPFNIIFNNRFSRMIQYHRNNNAQDNYAAGNQEMKSAIFGASGSRWRNLDDRVMGGVSESGWESNLPTRDTGTEDVRNWDRWKGKVIVEGGGFCGTVMKGLNVSVGGFDGVGMQVRGDGKIYKLSLRLLAEEGINPADDRLLQQYQCPFETIPGEWTHIRLPFASFLAVQRNKVNRAAPPLIHATRRKASSSVEDSHLKEDEQRSTIPATTTTSTGTGVIYSLGLVQSRFGFDGAANPVDAGGDFCLDVREIGLYALTPTDSRGIK